MSLTLTSSAYRLARAMDIQAQDSLMEIVRIVKSGSTVLHVGAMPVALGRFLASEGCIVDGVETNSAAAKHAHPYYRTLFNLDLDESVLCDHFACRYDAIICIDALENVRNPGRLLDQLSTMLTERGRVIISTINVRYVGIAAGLVAREPDCTRAGPFDERCSRFFTRKSLLDILGAHGLGAEKLHAVTAHADQIESTQTTLERLPSAVLEALLSAPDSLTYRFIVEAAPGLLHAPALREIASESVRFGLRLFWAGEGEHYDEKRFVAASAFVSEKSQRVLLALPRLPAAPMRLRLNVADRPGYLRLHALELQSQEGELLWRWNGRPESLETRQALTTFVGPLGASWLSTGSEPSFEIPLTPDVACRISSGRVVVQFDWPASDDHLLTADALHSEEQCWAVERIIFTRRMARLEEQIARLERERKAADLELSELKAELRSGAQVFAKQATETGKRLRHLEDSVVFVSHTISNRLLALEAGSALRKIVRQARRTILRPVFRLKLQPEQHVRAVGDQVGEWEATGSDPCFQLLSNRNRFPSGWVLLDIALDSPVHDRSLLYLDTGLGYSEHEAVNLPAPESGHIRLLLRLPSRVRAMRFDPVECPGRFHLGELKLREVGTAEAAIRLAAPIVMSLLRQPSSIPRMTRKLVRLLRSSGLRGIKSRLVERNRCLAIPNYGTGYGSWVEQFDTLSDEARSAIRKRIAMLSYRPLLSVVMPTYETHEKWLRRAIESIQRQLYENWELCIADDASKSTSVLATLKELSQKDPHIRVTFRDKNGHISEASNSALELAHGEFVVLLDHDDELPEHALYRVVEELNAHPDAGILFSDEDKIDEQSQRFDPYFKSDWNPDLFYSHNLISHLGVYRTSLVREVGGFRKGLEGGQDYDLALRVIERIRPEQICHIPDVLYHWRAIRGSTALSADQKSYAEVAARKAIQDHFDRMNMNAVIEPGPAPGLHRARFRLPAQPPLASIIIPTRNGLPLLKRCLDSIRQKTSYSSYEIIIVDNQSDDPDTLHYLRNLESAGVARVITYPHPFNYSAINNLAAREAKGALLAFLNNDLEVIAPGWLEEMASHALRPEVGAAGARLLYPDGTLQHAGIFLGIGADRIAGSPHQGVPRASFGYFGRACVLQDFSAVTAACLVIRRAVFEEVGGFDEAHLPVSYNDVDLCLRVREKGRRILWTPYAELYHFESATRGSDLAPEKRERFLREVQYMQERWGKLLLNDPFYNPNLSLDSGGFELARPPRHARPWDSVAK